MHRPTPTEIHYLLPAEGHHKTKNIDIWVFPNVNTTHAAGNT